MTLQPCEHEWENAEGQPTMCPGCMEREIERLQNQLASTNTRSETERLNREQQSSSFAKLLADRDRKIKQLQSAIDRSGFDVSPCTVCGYPVVCLPDGLPMCETCHDAC